MRQGCSGCAISAGIVRQAATRAGRRAWHTGATAAGVLPGWNDAVLLGVLSAGPPRGTHQPVL